MKISRSAKIQLLLVASSAGVIAVIIAVSFLGDGPIAVWIQRAAWLGTFVYLGIVLLAPFGHGPLGPAVTKAALEDERDSWRN